MKEIDEETMTMSQAAQFIESGKLLICSYQQDTHCSVTDMYRRGFRSRIYNGYDFAWYSVETLANNDIWISGGTRIEPVDINKNVTDKKRPFRLSPSKAVYTFTEKPNGLISKRRADFDLPHPRMFHCFIPTCSNTHFLFGGYNETDCFPSSMRSSSCDPRKVPHSDFSRTAFIMMQNGSWIRVPELSPCFHTDHYDTHRSACAMRRYGPDDSCEGGSCYMYYLHIPYIMV